MYDATCHIEVGTSIDLGLSHSLGLIASFYQILSLEFFN